MNKKQTHWYFLAILFVLWLPFYFGYVNYDTVGEVDLLSPTFIFENPDLDNLVADQQGKIVASSLDPDLFHLLNAAGSPEIHLLPVFHALSSAQSAIPLRC